MIRTSTRIDRRAVAVVAVLFAACGGSHRSGTLPTAPPPGPGSTAAKPVDAPAPRPMPPPAVKAAKVRSFEGIDEYVLPNGLRVLLFPDASQPKVTVNITYLVGSMHEGSGETGMAHLLEHMLFKGTPTHRNVLKLLDERGAFANGTTWQDRTNYYETLPATGDNLAWALGLEADRMLNASISDEDLATEFSVVRNEMEASENDPRAILEQRITAAAYQWHNYGKDTIGSRSDVENVPTARLRAFYERYYQPDNALLVVAGKFDAAEALAQIEAKFGPIPKPARALPPTYTVEPVQDGERAVILRRTGDVHLALALYHGVAGADPDHVALSALGDVLTREPTGRLYQQLVVPGIAAEVWSTQYLFRDPSYVLFGLKARDGKTIARATDLMIAAVEGFAKKPVTNEEVERFRASAQKDLQLALADSERIAVELSEWMAVGDWRLIFAYRERLKSLTAADVQRVALAYLKSSNRTLGTFVPTAKPDRAPLPPRPDVAAIVEKLVPSEGAAGEVFDASLRNLKARTDYRELAGGLKAAFVTKKTRGGKVVVHLRFRHGDLSSLAGKAVVASLVGRLAVRGTKTRSYAQIHDEQDRLTSNIDVQSSVGLVTVRLETVRESLPAVIDLVADILKNPTLSEQELAVVRQEAVSNVEEALQDPTQLGFTRLEQRLSPYGAADPRATLAPADQIALLKKVSAKDVRAYHAKFWGAGHGEVAAVGDFDADALAKQLEAAFAGWKTQAPYARLPDQAFGAPAASERVDTKDKEMALLVMAHEIAIDERHPDAPALALASHILGGSTGSRLWMRMREKEGFSYGTWGGLFPGDLDPVGRVMGGAILAPSNLAKGKAAMLEELARLRKDGVTAEEVEVARKAWMEQSDNALADDNALVGLLRRDRFLGRDFGWHEDFRAKMSQATADDVNRVVRQYLQPDKLIVIEAGDLAKAGPQP